MKAEFSALIRAGRVPECYRATALTDVAAVGRPCSIMIVPLAGGAMEDIATVNLRCKPTYNSADTDAPAPCHDWSPLIVDSVSKVESVEDGTEYVLDTDFTLYYAPITIHE